MPTITKPYSAIAFLAFVFICTASCSNNSADIPFPSADTGFAQPVTVPLQFGPERKANWVAINTGIKPVIRKLDLNALPQSPWDTSGFRPFEHPPLVTSFNFDSLSSKSFKYDSLPATRLQFRTFAIAPPIITKMGLLVPERNTPFLTFDMGKLFGLTNYTNDAGILKDKKGNIWVGDSLNFYMFDGENLMTYKRMGVLSPILGMTDDNNGRIWFLQKEGIGYFDPLGGLIRFSQQIIPAPWPQKLVEHSGGGFWLSLSTTGNLCNINTEAEEYRILNKLAGLFFNYTQPVVEDNMNNLWVAVDSGAVAIKLEKGTIRYIKIVGNEGQGVLGWIRDAVKDNLGNIWFLLSNGCLSSLSFDHKTITQYAAHFKSHAPLNIYFDHKGRIVVHDLFGLETWDIGKEQFSYIGFRNVIPRQYPTVYSPLVPDRLNRLWVLSLKSIYLIDPVVQLVVYLEDSQITSAILEDVSGKIWICTTNGIEIFDRKRHLNLHLNKVSGLSSNNVHSINQFDGKIWLASDGGLDVIDPLMNIITHYGTKQGLSTDTIFATLQDGKRNIWLSGANGGICFIDNQQQTIRYLKMPRNFSCIDSSYFSWSQNLENIVDIRKDKNGGIWIEKENTGVYYISPDLGTIKYLQCQYAGFKATGNVLAPDEAGRMWIGTSKGIFIADTRVGTFTAITTKQGLPSNDIRSLAPYKGGMVVATDSKICIVSPPAQGYSTGSSGNGNNTWEIKVVAKSEGLVRGSPDLSLDIVTKGGQYIWTGKGVISIDSIIEQTDNSQVYVSGINVMVRPQYFFNKPELKQHDTIWDGASFAVKGRGPAGEGFKNALGLLYDDVAGPYNMPKNLRLPYNQNYIQFQFTQAHTGRQDSVLYRYILQGVDKQWGPVTTKSTSENYLNLQPGSYTFKVCSKGISGRWGQPATFSFTVTPPWWQTWWAYTLYIFLPLASAWVIVYVRSKSLLERNRVLEEKIKQRTAEVQEQKEEITAQRDSLEKTLEELQATQKQLIQSEKMASLGELTAGIAHEIQNPLNFVNNFSEVSNELLEELKDERQKPLGQRDEELQDELLADISQNLAKINHHGKRADAIVKGMLQHSRKSTGQKEPTDIHKLADEYLRLAYQGLRAKDKGFNAEIKKDFDETIGKVNIIPQDIGRVLLNLVNNAFYAIAERQKKGGQAYKPIVSVATKKVDNKIEIRVADNGTGIPDAIKDKIMQPFFTTKPTGQGTGLGLSLSYDIVKAHGGEIRVETKEGEGTEFTITLPII